MIEVMSGRSSVCVARSVVLSDGLDAFEEAATMAVRVRIVVKVALYMVWIHVVFSVCVDIELGERGDEEVDLLILRNVEVQERSELNMMAVGNKERPISQA